MVDLADMWSIQMVELPKSQLNIHLQSCDKLQYSIKHISLIQYVFILYISFSVNHYHNDWEL